MSILPEERGISSKTNHEQDSNHLELESDTVLNTETSENIMNYSIKSYSAIDNIHDLSMDSDEEGLNYDMLHDAYIPSLRES